MNKITAKKILLNSSLFSTTRYSILKEKTLEISQISHSNEKKSLISLDSVDPEIKIQSRPNDMLVVLSLILFIFSFLLLNSTQESYLLGGVITSLFMMLSITTSVIAFKYQTISYSFFLSKTGAKAFSITETQKTAYKSTKSTTGIEMFITSLQKKIIESHKRELPVSNFQSPENKLASIKEKVDAIFNCGLINKVMYENIMSKAQHKISGRSAHQSPSSDNIINFQSRKLLKESA